MKMFIAAGWRDGMKIAAGYGIEKLCFGPSQKAMTLKLLFCRNIYVLQAPKFVLTFAESYISNSDMYAHILIERD